jgi:hypothetical protein
MYNNSLSLIYLAKISEVDPVHTGTGLDLDRVIRYSSGSDVVK